MTGSTKKPPRRTEPAYNQRLAGVYGEFGSGAGSRAFYLQSAMSPRDLDRIKLVSDIPGSERWPVRALFQREIDKDRVTTRLIPYLRNVNQVRFFNPLTLTLLPMDQHGQSVLPNMPDLSVGKTHLGDDEWSVLERPKFYRLRWVTDAPEYAVLEWNDSRSALVAIDGQHRLFGLKRLWKDKREVPPGEDFLQWRIPVVVVSFRGEEGVPDPPTVLDTVRSIFVSINTEAQRVNEARQILLSDNSVNALCTQELIELAHSNDTRTDKARNEKTVPLLFYDWRGEEKSKEKQRSPAAFKTIVEIHNWFIHYFLAEDFHVRQKDAMEIVPTHDLHQAFSDRRLTHRHAEHVRTWACERFLPGFTHLLETFEPSRQYIAAIRAIERGARSPASSDLRRHALDVLRFGDSHGGTSIQREIDDEHSQVVAEIEDAKKQHLEKLLVEDIGFRGIACAFGKLRGRFYGPPDWLEYARWFTSALNAIYRDGWISLGSRRGNRRFLRHVVEDHAETVVNYRLGDAHDAFGAYVGLLVAAYGHPCPEEWRFQWDAYREQQFDTLEGTVRRGFRKQVRPELREDFPEGGVQLTQAVNIRAASMASDQIRSFRKKVEKTIAKR